MFTLNIYYRLTAKYHSANFDHNIVLNALMCFYVLLFLCFIYLVYHSVAI